MIYNIRTYNTIICICALRIMKYLILFLRFPVEVDLGDDCPMDDICGTENALCGGSGKCKCLPNFFDDNGDSVYGGQCLPSTSV